ncbi:MAG: site-specific integrase [Syntrophomonas sp.]
MNFVEPIRDPAVVEDIANYLRSGSERNYIMFLTGIYTALRITDILSLKVYDVKNKNHIKLREKKTGKQRIIELNPLLKKALNNYVKDKDPEEYLIKSRQSHNKPIDRSMAYKILQNAAREFHLENVGTHTLRKTFGYHYYTQTKDIASLMKILNHSRQTDTLRYIGIEQEHLNKSIKHFRIY